MRANSRLVTVLLATLLCQAGCGEEADSSATDTATTATADTTADTATTADTDTAADTAAAVDAGPTERFAIAAIGDPHITGTSTKTARYKRLQAAVAWINDNAAARKIEVALVLGDIGWSGGLAPARAALDKLAMPYVPTPGDNVMFAGDEKTFDDVFGPVYAGLQGKLANLSRAATPTVHGVSGKQVILQNLSFDIRGVHVVAFDNSPRTKAGAIGEQGDLHDYKGGTWPWLKADLAALTDRPQRSVLLASHIPLHQTAGALDAGQMKKVNALVDATKGLVHGHIAGHYHVDVKIQTDEMDFVSHVVGSTFAGPLVVHIATAAVYADEVKWSHDKVHVPGFQ